MNAVLVPERNKAEVNYVAFKNIELRYPAGSAIATQLDGKTDRVNFTIEGGTNSIDNGISSAISAFNAAMVAAGSPVQVTQLKLTYTGVIKGGPTNTLISYKIEAFPIMEHFVISQGSEGGLTGDIVDLEWRAIRITQPIQVNAPDIGKIEINQPIGLIQAKYPNLAQQISSSPAAEIFNDPILNFQRFNQKIDTWHFLFDPSGSIVESSAFFRESSGAKVVSIFSLGESSFREGTFEAEEKDVKANIGGADVQVHSQVPAPSGQIQVAGFAKADSSKPDAEFLLVTKDAPEGFNTATGGFPIQVLLVLGGMMGAIAVFILWKARK
ncbi:MAG: hypothetical protein C4292_03595 [Nitrososphaera sp.]